MATTSVARLMGSVDEVLSDRDALEAFKKWTSMNASRCSSSIDLHFAIKQFRSVVDRKPSDAASLAVQAHKSFISKKTGTCSFLNDSLRMEMSKRAHSIKNSPPSKDFFDIIIQPLYEYLRTLHASFVCSEAFYTLMKEINSSLERPSTSTASPTIAAIKKERSSSVSSPFSTLPSKSNPFSSNGKPFTVESLANAHLSSNPFRLFKNDSIKVESYDLETATMNKRHGPHEGSSFADTLGDKLQRLADAMSAKGVEFARDLSDKPTFDDLTDEAIDKDIDDYADRMDAKGGVGGVSKRSTSRSPPSLPVTSPPLDSSSYSAYGKNGFAPPPSNRLRRKYMDTMSASFTSSTSGCLPQQTSPTAGTSSKKGRPSIDHDSSSSGFYSGLPSSSSSAFSSHFSVPHFNTLRRPSHNDATMGGYSPRTPHFPTLARPSFTTESLISSSFVPSSFSPLTPGSSPSHHINYNNDRTLPSGFATLPRPQTQSRVPTAPGSSASSNSTKNDGKILLKVVISGSRPMVFRTEPTEGGMTLKKFRTIFGIGKEKSKFFFKNECEDESSDYQWDLISDDESIVPLYKGAITAECRPALDSPE